MKVTRGAQNSPVCAQYEFDSKPLEQVPDYKRFKEELSALRLQERLARQDRPQERALSAEVVTDNTSAVADSQDTLPRGEVVATLPAGTVASNGTASLEG